MASNREKIVSYIREKGQATVLELYDALDIERAMIHRHLKSLVEDGLIRKIGSSPRVVYVIADDGQKESPIDVSVSVASASIRNALKKIIDDNFLLVTPRGERVEGVVGFVKWCVDRHYDISKKAEEYGKLFKKYSSVRKNGLLDGTKKFRETFDNDCFVDRVYYVDFYAWEIFGKTKLGQLLLYAKQSQDRKMIREVAESVRSSVEKIVAKHRVGAIGYIPPTVKRSVQLMDELKRIIRSPLPEVVLEKITGEVRVPQKTLSKLEDRIQNAHASIFVSDKRVFETVLLVDDAVGSGATFNEVARKLKERGTARRVIGLAIAGSAKGFDVISEV